MRTKLFKFPTVRRFIIEKEFFKCFKSNEMLKDKSQTKWLNHLKETASLLPGFYEK